MRKKINILLLTLSLSFSAFAQVNTMYNNLFFKQIGNQAFNNLDEKPSIHFIYNTHKQLEKTNNHTVGNGRFLVNKINYGLQVGALNHDGIKQTDVQANAMRNFRINDHSSVAIGVNLSYFNRQMERPNNQTENDLLIINNLDYNNVYGGFSLAYSFKDLRVGLSSADLFNTSLDQKSSWNLQADYKIDVLDSTMTVRPVMMINTGYDLHQTIAMIGMDVDFNKYIHASTGYYTNEAVHLGMGFRVNNFIFDYRHRFFYSQFRNISSSQNTISIQYKI
jgi:hypothetical protein